MEQYKKIENELLQTEKLSYHISNLGNVKSVHKINKTEKLLKSQLNTDGYNIIELGYKQCRVAKLMGETFLAKPESAYHTIDHIDRNRCNDNINNLRWASKSEQQQNSSNYRHDIIEKDPKLRRKIIEKESRDKLGYNDKVECDCGKTYMKCRKLRHIKTEYHQRHFQNNNL